MHGRNLRGRPRGQNAIETVAGVAYAPRMNAAPQLALLVASLEDVLASKRAADRPRDRAVLPVLEETLEAKQRQARGE